ncbi:MAG: hypothetical protein LBQ24_07130 [Candidatus Peribacteria bacterium]|nr:hypothetical protein [Candidatus Peribacteria bacterium]
MDVLTNVRLRTPNGTYINANSSSGTEIKFTNINLSDVIKTDTTATFYLTADAITNTGADFSVNLSG